MPRTPITPGFNFVTGAYTGDGNTVRYVDVGFQPTLFIVKAITNQYAVFKTSDMPNDSTAYIANGAGNFSGAIHSFHTKGVRLGSGATVNSAGVTYFWIAVSPSTSNDFATFTYTGTGAALNVTGLGFQPDVVFVKRDGASSLRFRDSLDTGATSHAWVASANETTSITAIGTDGFTLGTNAGVNSVGDTYYGFAFKDANNGILKVLSYTGNGADDRSITGVGFQSSWIVTKDNTNSGTNSVRTRIDKFVGDITSSFANTAVTTADNIQAIESDGFQIGANNAVNQNSSVYHVIAFKAHRSRVAA